MSDGITHGRLTVALAIPSGFVAAMATQSIPLSAMVVIGCLSGLFIDPDLDQPMMTKSKTRLMRWFLPAGYLWGLIWSLYSWLIPHRSFISHAPFIGTIGRMAYLIVILSIISAGTFYHWLLANVPTNYFLSFVVGLSISDIGHWIADWKT